MKPIADLKDNEYPNNGFTHTRNTVRALVFNDKNEICMFHIVGEDFFGKRNHFETPAGGVEANENYHEALKRELREEIGFRCEIVSELCMIVSRYNLIKRINVSWFYIAKIIEKEKLHRTDEEKVLINSVVFKIVDAWLAALEKADNPVDRD